MTLQVGPDVELTDPTLSLKGVLKERVLQEKPGVSIAVEAGLLLPSTLPQERGVGFEAIGIVSGMLAPVTLHVNGGGVDRNEGHAFGIWGVTGELPIHARLRLVGGVRRGISSAAPDWAFTIGVTFRFATATIWRE